VTVMWLNIKSWRTVVVGKFRNAITRLQMDRLGRNLGGRIPSCSQYWKYYNSSYIRWDRLGRLLGSRVQATPLLQILIQKTLGFLSLLRPIVHDTSKTAKITCFILVLHWAMDVIYDFYYIHGPMEYWNKPSDFCCFRCVMNNGP